MHALASGPSLWLIQPGDIVAHLYFVAASISEVVATGPGLVLTGRMRYPEGGVGVLTPSAPFDPIAAGTPVCIEYTSNLDHYRFYSRVVSCDPFGDVRIALPRAIERRDRRLNERFPIPRAPGYGFRPTSPVDAASMPLHDLSVGGVGLVHFGSDSPWNVGDLVDGDVLLPGEHPLPTCLEVRHARPIPRRPGETLVGTRITAIATIDRARLARWLAAYAHCR
ncbi:MAG: flagellar brake protein [Myxococcota bacterium]